MRPARALFYGCSFTSSLEGVHRSLLVRLLHDQREAHAMVLPREHLRGRGDSGAEWQGAHNSVG